MKSPIAAISLAAASALVLGMSPVTATTAQAATPATSTCVASAGMLHLANCQFSETDAQFIQAVARVSQYYYLADGHLQINRSDAELVSHDGFTPAQVQRLHRDVLGFAVAAAPRASAPSIAGLSMLGRSGVCFSHNDLMTGVGVAFAAAAAAGPEATMAALVALSTAVGGVPGGVLGTIVSLLSVPTAASIAKKTVVAVATGRGVGIKVVFDYPPVQAVYC